ncbi:MAG: hypothetical protein AAF557_27605 [Pseudomonadota bacterium]
MRTLRNLLAVLTLGVMPAPAFASDLDMVVYRYDDAVEVFISARADVFAAAFDMADGQLNGRDGVLQHQRLNIEARQISDVVLARSEITIGGEQSLKDPMGLVVHPLDQAVAVETPLDAVSAIAGCKVPLPDGQPDLAVLQAYFGIFIEAEDPLQTIELTFPGAETPLSVDVRDFHGLEEIGRSTLIVAENGVLTIPTGSAPDALWQAWTAPLGGALAGFAGLLFGWRRFRQAS